MQVPIRPTESQELVPEPLPCDPNESMEIDAEDPIRPFTAEEYKVLTVTPSELSVTKEVPTFTHDTPYQSTRKSAVKVVNTLESELDSSRKETTDMQNEIVKQVEKVKRTMKRMREIETQIGKADFLIQNRTDAMKTHE